MGLNQLRISAIPMARQVLRYTPAGLAVSEASFRHDGAVLEAGEQRTLGFEFPAVAVGPIAVALDREPLGQPLQLAGFIAPRSKRSNRLVMHVTDYQR